VGVHVTDVHTNKWSRCE